jgi:hypothetical protein
MTIQPAHFLELQKKGYSLDLVYILKLIDEGHDIHELYAQSAKMEVLVLSLIRKDLISKDKLTITGQELLKFLEMESTVKLVKKKKDSTAFDKWWLAFPGTDTFVHKGKTFKGCRSLKADKENCRLKFEKILNEGEHSSQVLISALEYDVLQKKDNSVVNSANKLTYLQNSLTYLNQRSYEPFIELINTEIDIKEVKQFKGTDV